jgi:hypothetical protein
MIENKNSKKETKDIGYFADQINEVLKGYGAKRR